MSKTKEMPDPVRKAFNKIKRELKQDGKKLDARTLALIENFAYSYHFAKVAQKSLIDEGIITKDMAHQGTLRKSPAWQVFKDAGKSMIDVYKTLNQSAESMDKLVNDPMMKMMMQQGKK